MLASAHIKDGKRYCLESEMDKYVHFAPDRKVIKDQPLVDEQKPRGRQRKLETLNDEI